MDFQFEDERNIAYSWQKSMYGTLSHDPDKNIYTYNPLAQQETYQYFNLGLLFPGQSTSFNKTVRTPKIKPMALFRFVVVSEKILNRIWAPSEKNTEIYESSNMEKLKKIGPQGTIIFDPDDNLIKTQSATLGFGSK